MGDMFLATLFLLTYRLVIHKGEQLAILTTQKQQSVTLLNQTAQTFDQFNFSLTAANGKVGGQGGRHLTDMLEAMKVRETSEDDLILLWCSIRVNADPADIAHFPLAMVAAYRATPYEIVGQGKTPKYICKHTHSTHSNSSLTEPWS